ncbi:MAG: alpha/beta fold hydrolase, partial [Pseudomonadota bacterium]
MKTKYPIILAHGIFRFDQLLNLVFHTDNRHCDGLHYFRKIRSFLKARGFEVYHTSARWGGRLEARAGDLKKNIETITGMFTKHEKVNIIGHSMGGLDARYMVCAWRLRDHVASISTISTPHWGTSFADWGLKRYSPLIPAAKAVGIDISGLHDLTRDSCARFNDDAWEYEQTNKVLYQTFAGTIPCSMALPSFRLPHAIISREEGENDGLVSFESAKWRDEFFVKKIKGDHLNEVGWWHPWAAQAIGSRNEFEKHI